VAVAAAIALRVAFQLWSGGPTLGRFRFLVPALPLIQALIVAGAASFSRGPRTRFALAAGACALALVPGWMAYPATEGYALRYGVGLQRAHLQLGQDLLEHTSPRAVMAMDDAGIAPLVCDRVNIDMMGLNDRHIAHLPGAFGEKVDIPYLLSRRPDIVVLISHVAHPARDEDFYLRPHALLFRDPAFRAAYGYSRRYEFYPGYELIVFRRHGSAEAPAAYWGGEGAVDPAN
jgi:hypothetical protein